MVKGLSPSVVSCLLSVACCRLSAVCAALHAPLMRHEMEQDNNKISPLYPPHAALLWSRRRLHYLTRATALHSTTPHIM